MVLALLLEADCRPVGQDVLAGEDFLRVYMRSHRPRSTYHKPTTTEHTTPAATDAAPTTLETEPPQVVSVRVSSSVRKEAVHDPINEPVHDAVSAAAQRSHFSVESSGYREASGRREEDTSVYRDTAKRREEDSVAEASQDNPSAQESLKAEENKPFAQALTLEESGIHYESRVSSETSQSRIYFSQPKPSSQKYQPQQVVTQPRDEEKYEPQIVTQGFTQTNGDRKYGPEIVVSQNQEDSKSQPQILYSQEEQGSKSGTQTLIADQTSKFEPDVIVTREETKYGPEIIVTQTQSEKKYTPDMFVPQSQPQSQEDIGPQTIISQTQATRKYVSQNREQRQFTPQAPQAESQPQEGNFVPQTQAEQGQYKSQTNDQRVERNYEQQEQNYEVDEAISVMTNGRAHGVQTESPNNHKFGFVQEGRNFRKYRVEEKTPDGFIVGEYGVVNHDGGGVRGVRYTADGSINPRLIYDALVRFLSLK